MTIVLDLIIIGVIILNIFLGSKRGFMRVAIELAGFAAVLLIAVWASNNLVEPIYNDNFKQGVETKISETITVDLDVSSAYKSLPEFVTYILKMQNIDEQTIEQYINSQIDKGAESVAPAVADYVVKPIVTSVISAVLMLAIFLIGMFLIKLLAKWVNSLIKKTPFVGKINSVLGAVVGLLKGVVISMAIIWILGAITSVLPNGILSITHDTVENAYICGIINDLNPLVD